MTCNDDAAAEATFQSLRATGRYDMLLEIAGCEALERRCGELHGRLLEHPGDHRLMALYGAYSHLRELCRGLTTDDRRLAR